eukprot:6683726-Alexandrium_andersonii.AAC.1
MSASLVGSEMCIRDRPVRAADEELSSFAGWLREHEGFCSRLSLNPPSACLLYTSDAADDM